MKSTCTPLALSRLCPPTLPAIGVLWAAVFALAVPLLLAPLTARCFAHDQPSVGHALVVSNTGENEILGGNVNAPRKEAKIPLGQEIDEGCLVMIGGRKAEPVSTQPITYRPKVALGSIVAVPARAASISLAATPIA